MWPALPAWAWLGSAPTPIFEPGQRRCTRTSPFWGELSPPYSLFALLGAAAAWGFFHHRLKARGENPGRWEQAFLWGLLGALVGAKALYLLSCLPQLAADLPLLTTAPAQFAARYLSGGFVFYGGLLGALAAAWLFCRKQRDFALLGADLVPALPLFHAIGRGGVLFCRVLLRHSGGPPGGRG